MNPGSDPGSRSGSSSSSESGSDFSNWSKSRETENQKRCHVASPESMPNLDKPDWKKKKSECEENPSKSHPKGDDDEESAQDKLTHRLGEELVQKYQADEEEKERQSQSKKPKKDFSSWKVTSTTQDSSKEDECEWRRRRKEKKAKACEAKLWAERERKEREEDKSLTREKLLNQLQREKYNLECPELRAYHRKKVTLEQRESVNLDDHTAYMTLIWQDISQYPHQNVMSCHWLLKQLEDHSMDKKAGKGLNSQATAGKEHALGDPVVEPKYFI